MSKLRVFIVDDHPIVRDGLKGLVAAQADMEVVGEAFDGETAVRRVLQVRPDVVVMDVSMPGVGGTEATARIHAASPEVRVVALTAHEDRGYVQQMLAAGASGYVLKRSAAADLVGAVRRAAAGDSYVDPLVAAQLVPGAGAAAEGEQAELSDREAETLKQIARGYSNKQTAARMGVSAKTVETYKARGMEKLGVRSRVDLVRYAADRGWLAGGDAAPPAEPGS